MKRFFLYFGRLLIICLFQAFIFERIQIGPFLYPCIYVLFILLFPFGYHTVYLLVWAFAIGLITDISATGMLGLHASASVCLALLRPNLLKLVTVKGEVGQTATPGLNTLGLTRYVAFVAVSLLIHHAVLFGWENFRLSYLYLTIARIVCSAALNTLLIVLVQATLFNRKRGFDS
ncbi:MAG: hypothetical protein FWD56_03130 [Bacteroidales bacterium]|nr:hypothetical protein [Bacteroidales bacterium]